MNNDLETALLAGLVSSNLTHVEKNMVNMSAPINRINLHNFVNKQPNQNQHNMNNANEVITPLMQKAIEDSMRAAAAIPDAPNNNMPPQMIPLPPQQPMAHASMPVQNAPAPSVGISSEDIQIIKSQLEKINTNLSKMAGMFGKVFATMTATNNSSLKNAK